MIRNKKFAALLNMFLGYGADGDVVRQESATRPELKSTST